MNWPAVRQGAGLMSKSFEFMVNLRSETMKESFINCLNPQGYLVSPVYFSPAKKNKLRSLLKNNCKAFLDNGNFSIVGRIEKEFKARASKALKPFLENKKQNGEEANLRACDRNAVDDITELAWEISHRAQDLVPTAQEILDSQRAVESTHLIGFEDVTMACWLAMNLEPELLDIENDRYRKLNSQVADRALQALHNLPPETAQNYYPVASAVSYDTAFDAGREFARRGIRKVAMGFGAYTADGNYCDGVVIKGKAYRLPLSVPARYIRMLLVARGFWEGYHDAAGFSPEAFHFLGLGTPLFMALCSLVTQKTKELTFDATSPVADAVDGTLYVSKPAYLKIQTRKIALRLATSSEATWNCPCPFCRDFAKKYPFNYSLGVENWQEVQRDHIEEEDLKPGGSLFDAYPFLSEPARGRLKTDISFARMGHNHWIIREVTDKLTAEVKKGTLKRHVSKTVKDYAENTKSKLYGDAARLALEIVSGKTIQNFTSSLQER